MRLHYGLSHRGRHLPGRYVRIRRVLAVANDNATAFPASVEVLCAAMREMPS